MKLIDKILSNMVKGFIFDLDGTLINTLSHHVSAFQKAFSDFGYNIDRKIIEHNMGRTPWDIPRDILFNKTLENLSDEEINIIRKIADLKINYYHQTLKSKIPIMNGAKELLSLLKNRRIKLAVCSSTPKLNVYSILKKIKLFHYFDIIITGDNVKVGKPNPQAFNLAVKKLKVNKEECYLIGDSIHDVIASKRAGIKCIAVCTGFHSKDELLKEKPDLLINNLLELL
ncbi:MAG: HAD family hydrolase [Candidatus Helarchaeota archaeon]